MRTHALVPVLALACALLPPTLGCGDKCQDAKRHMCEKIPDMNCLSWFMDNAVAGIKADCGEAEAAAYIPWLERQCKANPKGLDCDAPGPGAGAAPKDGGVVADSKPCGTPMTFNYSGVADADNRAATLELTLDGTTAKGKLHADPVCGTSVRLTRTDIEFAGTRTGTWESAEGSIAASWTGGDYDCEGKLMADYPTSGSLTITVQGNQVILKRIATAPGSYVFSTSGRVYTPPDC
jgi:hypothetical protein